MAGVYIGLSLMMIPGEIDEAVKIAQIPAGNSVCGGKGVYSSFQNCAWCKSNELIKTQVILWQTQLY